MSDKHNRRQARVVVEVPLDLATTDKEAVSLLKGALGASRHPAARRLTDHVKGFGRVYAAEAIKRNEYAAADKLADRILEKINLGD